MTTKSAMKIILAGALALHASLGVCADHTSRGVLMIQPPQVSADCLFFKLDGVSEADPVLSGNPWFAVPRTHPGFRETFAILLATQKSGTTVWARTTGQAAGGACGQNVGVDFVISNPG